MIPAAPPIIISPSGPNRASKRWPCQNNKISATGAFSPTHADRRLRETERAPVKSSKTVIDLVTGLQCRGTDHKTQNLRLPTKARISANRLEPRIGCLCCGTARHASVRSAEAPRTSKSASAPEVEASTVPLASEARIKLSEPQSRIRP